MEKIKFTSGPWEVCEHSWSDISIYAEEGHKTICTNSIEEEADEDTEEELEAINLANMKLISVAPEMYCVLEKIKDIADSSTSSWSAISDLIDIYDEIESILAKVRGENQQV